MVSAGALTVSLDHKWLFVVNAGDGTVSSFEIDNTGEIHPVDTKSTESTGTPSTLSYNAGTSTLYVGHTFGPEHIKVFSVRNGRLELRPGSRSVNNSKAKDRILTQVRISPDQKYLLANVLYDKRPESHNGKVEVTPANKTAKDGLVVFPVDGSGSPGEPKFYDAGGSTPFGLTFIPGSGGLFVNTFDEAPGIAVLSRLNQDGSVTNLSRAQVNLSVPGVDNIGACWVSMSPDGKTAFVAASDSGEVASFRINGNKLVFAKGGLGLLEKKDTSNDPSAKATGSPVGNWISPNGYLYQLYPSAARLVAYRINDDALERIGSYAVPLNSPEGISGF
ncbi:beta-propeller fold lactonase family protein [Klebsiella aerogenes]|uniref:beta-propeller fold lactonase family protein n=1 Tax=Klebsiella aerogenes TaxID=548 RepID=UPI0037AB79EA